MTQLVLSGPDEPTTPEAVQLWYEAIYARRSWSAQQVRRREIGDRAMGAEVDESYGPRRDRRRAIRER